MKPRPILWMASLVLALSFTACNSSPAPLTPPPPSPSTPPPPPGTDPVAISHQLVGKLQSAKTEAERLDALTALMKALNIGVYTTDGKTILRGAERSDKDFYMYDLELKILAASLGRNDTTSLPSMAKALNQIGIFADDHQLSEGELKKAIQEASRAASQNKNDPASLGMLLVRELGQGHAEPYDTNSLEIVPTSKVQLDAVQRFLLMAEVGLGILKLTGPATAHSQLSANSGGLLRQNAPSTSACEGTGTIVDKAGPWTIGKWFLSNLPKLKDLNTLSKATLVTIDSLHGVMMAGAISVQAIGERNPETQYGGKPIVFRVWVVNNLDLPETLIQCGWLLGVEFPKPGGIPGVTVWWVQFLSDDLRKHGTLSCGTPCTSETGADGQATLTFIPRTEEISEGEWVYQAGNIGGDAFVQMRLKNTLGAISNLIMPAASGWFGWTLKYHKGWKGKVSHIWNWDQSHNDSKDGVTDDTSQILSWSSKAEVVPGKPVKAEETRTENYRRFVHYIEDVRCVGIGGAKGKTEYTERETRTEFGTGSVTVFPDLHLSDDGKSFQVSWSSPFTFPSTLTTQGHRSWVSTCPGASKEQDFPASSRTSPLGILGGLIVNQPTDPNDLGQPVRRIRDTKTLEVPGGGTETYSWDIIYQGY